MAATKGGWMRATFVVVASIVLSVSSARAEDRTEEMREHFNRGQDAYEQKQYDVAASEFRAAYSLKPAAPLLYNEAMCYVKIDDRARAVALLERYLAEAPHSRDAAAV